MEGINPLRKNSLALEGAVKKAFIEAKIENFKFYRSFFNLMILKMKLENQMIKKRISFLLFL